MRRSTLISCDAQGLGQGRAFKFLHMNNRKTGYIQDFLRISVTTPVQTKIEEKENSWLLINVYKTPHADKFGRQGPQ